MGMSGMAVGPARKRRLMGMIGAVLLLSAPAAYGADEPTGAAIQWAQQILEEQGLYRGRAHGRLDAATVTALTAFQRKQGLTVTGKLDQPTIDRLLEGRPVQKTVGNLADPASRARSSGPMLREQDVRPDAAPAAPGVERGEGGESSSLVAGAPARPPAQGGVVGPQTAALPPLPKPMDAGGAPMTASREKVEIEGQSPDEAAARFGGLPMDVIRLALLGGVALLALGMAIVYWSSGRRGRPAPRRGSAMAGTRRDPRVAQGASGLRAEPGLRGPSRR